VRKIGVLMTLTEGDQEGSEQVGCASLPVRPTLSGLRSSSFHQANDARNLPKPIGNARGLPAFRPRWVQHHRNHRRHLMAGRCTSPVLFPSWRPSPPSSSH
jgi:hypothetical protein